MSSFFLHNSEVYGYFVDGVGTTLSSQNVLTFNPNAMTNATGTSLNLSTSFTLAGSAATGIGYGIGKLLQYDDPSSTGIPHLHTTGRLIVEKAPGTEAASDFATMEVRRATAFSGGAGAFNGTLRVATAIGAGNAAQEWGIISSSSTSSSSGGGVVGMFAQTIRNAGATDGVISLIGDTVDNTGLSSSASGAHITVACELDIEANRADDVVNLGLQVGVGARTGLNIVAFRHIAADTTQTEFALGISFTTATGGTVTAGDAHTNYQSVIGFGVNTQIRNGLDTRGAITPAGSGNPVSAVTMTAGHIIDFNGPTTIAGAPRNYFWYDNATSKLKYNVGATTVMSIDASGNARFLGTVTGSVTP